MIEQTRHRTNLLGLGASRRARPSAVTAALAVGVVALVFVLAAPHASKATLRGSGASTLHATAPSRGSTDAVSPKTGFQISGSVGGLYPGETAPLMLRVTNPQPFAIVVTSIATTAGSPNPGCLASYLTVAGFSGQLTVAAQSSGQISVPVTLSHAAPNACQGASFPLTYTGSAHKA